LSIPNSVDAENQANVELHTGCNWSTSGSAELAGAGLGLKGSYFASGVVRG
jgi:hypothetical protein